MEDEYYAEYYPDYEESYHSDDPFGSSNNSSSEEFPSDEEPFKEDHYVWDCSILGRKVMVNKEGHVVFRDQNLDEAEDYLTCSSDDSNESDSSDETGYRVARTTKVLRQSAQTITDVIKSDMSLLEIQDVIEKEHLPLGGFAACFRRKKDILKLFRAVLKRSTSDILELVLENGLDPNTTWSRRSEKYTTLLQLAVEHGNPKVVELLVKHGAIVNKGYPSNILQGTLIDASGPIMHRNALSSALKKDDPKLMKPLVEHYDGTMPALLLALELNAAKCAEILIENEKQHDEIKAGKIPLSTGIRYGVKLIPKLYEIGAGVYSKEDLDNCLYAALDEKTYKSATMKMPLGLDKRLTTLIELGADVNCKLKRRPWSMLGMFLRAYSGYTPKQELAILSVLLEHGAIALPNEFKEFVCNQTSRMYGRHFQRQKGALSVPRLLSITKEKFSLIKKVTAAYGRGRDSDKSMELLKLLDSRKNMFSYILLTKHSEKTHCKEMTQLVFDVVLTFDLGDGLSLYSSMLNRCSCLYNIAETLMLLQTHSIYQELLSLLDNRHFTTREQRKELSLRFPQVRTLTKLAHVEIFCNLRFPKRESVESLGLPKLLQDLICLA